MRLLKHYFPKIELHPEDYDLIQSEIKSPTVFPSKEFKAEFQQYLKDKNKDA